MSIYLHDDFFFFQFQQINSTAETTDTFTEDGFEVTFQTNYLSPIYLTMLLIGESLLKFTLFKKYISVIYVKLLIKLREINR